MSIDLDSILAGISGTVQSVVTSSKTVGTISRDPDGNADAAVDPATLVISDATPYEPVATDVPALVVPDRTENRGQGPHLVEQVNRWRILCLPDADLHPGDLYTATGSRDARLVGLPLFIVSAGADSTGLLRQASAVAAPSA